MEHDRNYHQTTRTSHVCSDLVLHRNVCNGCGTAPGKLLCNSSNSFQKLFMVCGCPRCISSVVVWSQCGGLLPYHTIPRPDVLLLTQSSKQASLLLPTFHHSFLVFDFYLHLG